MDNTHKQAIRSVESFNQVLGGIRQMMQIQKIIAVKNGRGGTYDEWGELEDLLTHT